MMHRCLGGTPPAQPGLSTSPAAAAETETSLTRVAACCRCCTTPTAPSCPSARSRRRCCRCRPTPAREAQPPTTAPPWRQPAPGCSWRCTPRPGVRYGHGTRIVVHHLPLCPRSMPTARTSTRLCTCPHGIACTRAPAPCRLRRCGPPSFAFVCGQRLLRLPHPLGRATHALLSPWEQDPDVGRARAHGSEGQATLVEAPLLLYTLNELLGRTAVLVQPFTVRASARAVLAGRLGCGHARACWACWRECPARRPCSGRWKGGWPAAAGRVVRGMLAPPLRPLPTMPSAPHPVPPPVPPRVAPRCRR